jgi:Methyltransferase FkbM domain
MNLIASFDDSLRAISRRLRGVPRQAVQIALPKLQLGACSVAPDLLDADSVIYSVGAQPISSFERALIERFGCMVHCLTLAGKPPPKISDRQPAHSQESDAGPHDGQEPDGLLDRLRRRMQGFGHAHIDLLRLDLEGGEYAAIGALRESTLRPCQLLIDFHHHLPRLTLDQTERALQQLNELGYRIFDCEGSGRSYSLALV